MSGVVVVFLFVPVGKVIAADHTTTQGISQMVLHLSSDPRLLNLQTYITHEMLGIFDPGMKRSAPKIHDNLKK